MITLFLAPVVWLTAEAVAVDGATTVRLTGAGAVCHDDDDGIAGQIVVTHWADWLDGWAVDFDADRLHDPRDGIAGQPLVSDWQAFRTKQDRRLPLVSAPHVYDRPGTYRIAVRGQSVFAYPCGCDLAVTV